MVQDFYKSIADKDFDMIQSLSESRFAKQVWKVIENNSKRGLELEFNSYKTPFIEQQTDTRSYIFDKMFEKGVYFDRTKNDLNVDYFLNNEMTSEGIRFYYHKYFTGLDHHYYVYPDEDGTPKKREESKYKFKYLMEARNRSIVFRIYGVMRNLGTFSNANSSNSLYQSSYRNNHIVIFENQLKEPPIISLTDPNIDRWLRHHKIDHNKWRISDIDNYMKGNPFFYKITDQEEFKKFVDRVKVDEFDPDLNTAEGK